MPTIITLLTDFGYDGVYVASVKGAILSINPSVVMVDICHTIAPQNIFQAGFVLNNVHKYFPVGTIHVIVVDPGVGSQRKIVILKTSSAYFIAPDNGVLTFLLDSIGGHRIQSAHGVIQLSDYTGDMEAVAVNNPDFYSYPVSDTFHGRDIFAPVAAHLSKGVPFTKFGKKIGKLHIHDIPRPKKQGRSIIEGQIVYIDTFGNLVTNIREDDLGGNRVTVRICNKMINDISKFYAQRQGLMAIIGSSGYLEIALANGSAVSYLGCSVGEKLELIPN